MLFCLLVTGDEINDRAYWKKKAAEKCQFRLNGNICLNG